MMDLDSAIQHCEEVAISKTKQVENGDWEKGSSTERDCIACAEEHQQLAEWLKELKAYKEQSGDAISRNDVIDTLNNMYRYVADELTLCSTGKKFEGTEVFIVDDVYEEIAENLPSVNPHPIECGDAISRQAVLEVQAKYAEYVGTTKFWQMRDDIKALPPVTPQQRTGRWVKEGQGGRYKWMCSNCGTHHRALYDYCPSCGTRMEVKE